MKFHILKTDKRPFIMTWAGIKDYEIRLNDRDFELGDIISLRETEFDGAEMKQGSPLRFTGRAIECIITGIISGYGLQDGWVLLSTKTIDRFRDIRDRDDTLTRIRDRKPF